jgi:hypothetical protein
MEKYNDFIKVGKSGIKTEPSQVILDEVQVNIPFILEKLKENYDIDAKYLYDNEISFSLKYSPYSDDNDSNIQKVKQYLTENLPYLKEFVCHKDDGRMVIKFLDMDDSLKYKFLK